MSTSSRTRWRCLTHSRSSELSFSISRGSLARCSGRRILSEPLPSWLSTLWREVDALLDYPQGVSDVEADAGLANAEDFWGTETMARLLAPSASGDAAFLSWFSRCMRLSCRPSDVKWLFQAVTDGDLRHVLPAVRVPTLVISHPASERGAASRYVAEHIDGARYVEVPGADALAFTGESGLLLDAVEEFVTGRLPTPIVDRVLATILFTDVVASTETAANLGDRRWRELLASHHDVVRAEIERHGGKEINTTGDGFLVTFDGPGRAIRAARAIRNAVRTLGIEIRAGLHTGEIEVTRRRQRHRSAHRPTGTSRRGARRGPRLSNGCRSRRGIRDQLL